VETFEVEQRVDVAEARGVPLVDGLDVFTYGVADEDAVRVGSEEHLYTKHDVSLIARA
jgi:hypothetical protein